MFPAAHEGVMPADVEAPGIGDFALGYQPKLGIGESVEGPSRSRRHHRRRHHSVPSQSASAWLVERLPDSLALPVLGRAFLPRTHRAIRSVCGPNRKAPAADPWQRPTPVSVRSGSCRSRRRSMRRPSMSWGCSAVPRRRPPPLPQIAVRPTAAFRERQDREAMGLGRDRLEDSVTGPVSAKVSSSRPISAYINISGSVAKIGGGRGVD